MSYYGKEFKHIDILGCGKFGVVFKVQHMMDKKYYAVKRIQLTKNTELERKQLIDEIKMHEKLNVCSQIVKCFGGWCESADFNDQAKRDRFLNISGLLQTASIVQLFYIQMELCGETLEQWLTRNEQRDKVQSVNIFKQMVQGLAHLHKVNIVHQDIKPSNILFAVNEKNSIRIADFGLAKHAYSGSGATNSFPVGTLLYMAPEILNNKCETKSDMYSAGLILIELLYNCSGVHHEKLLNDAKDMEFPASFQGELKFSLSLLRKLLSGKVKDWPSSAELLNTLSTDPDWNEETKLVCPQQAEWKFVSTCTSKEHLVSQKTSLTSSATFTWSGDNDLSGWLSLPVGASTNTQWEVQFLSSNNNFAIDVFCKSLDEHFRTASFRLSAKVENHPEVWREVAAVLKSDERLGWWSYFPKKLSEFFKGLPIKIHVRIHWTELEQLTPLLDLWKNDDPVCLQCHWQLHRWKTVSPTTDLEWRLYSEPFGQGGLVWRIIVTNSRDDNDRKLEVRVELQHIPTSIDCTGLSMHCSLSLWKKSYDEQMDDMEESSHCDWTVIDATRSETRDPLDLEVIIRISQN